MPHKRLERTHGAVVSVSMSSSLVWTVSLRRAWYNVDHSMLLSRSWLFCNYSMKPHSGLQLQVLGLYRQALRIARRKDLVQDPLATKTASESTYAFVRERFREDVRMEALLPCPWSLTGVRCGSLS